VLAHVDGPYGTASRHLLEVPHAVAIAGGIGVTPFGSILQSLLLRSQDPHAPQPALRKLRFVWLNRDQYSFEWFSDLLAELEQRDRHGLLDIHTFMTAGRADMAGGLLDFAWLLTGRRSRGDLVTGLKAQTNLGAPDFDRLLQSFVHSADLPRPQVFFCGPLPLERVVARSCRRLGLRLRRERF
jgi:ferredoxin-NADP reductase